MKYLAPLTLVLFLAGGCSYVTKSKTGAEFAATQQPSAGGGAPGATHYEYRPSAKAEWKYLGTAVGGTLAGELAGPAAAVWLSGDTISNSEVIIEAPGPPGR